MDAILHRKPPTIWDQFLEAPLPFLARVLYYMFPDPSSVNLDNPAPNSVRVVCISDTHNGHDAVPPLPAGDILIHSGDLTDSGSLKEVIDVLEWMSRQPHEHKIFIGGNHDKCLCKDPACIPSLQATYSNLIYLEDSSTTLSVRDRSLVVYGSPRTPAHGSGGFQYPRIRALCGSGSANAGENPWKSIPEDTDILITHGPPAYHLDCGVGCIALLDALWRVRPRLTVFGHIHAGRGVENVSWGNDQAAYEAVSGRRAGFLSLFVILWGTAYRRWRRKVSGKTILVNAASAGGYGDEKRRGAIVVDI